MPTPLSLPSNDTMMRTFVRANKLLDQHNLTSQGWTFEFNNTKQIMGQCCYSKKKIYFSLNFLSNSWEEIEDTLLHEVAHALAPGEGHNYIWKTIARSIGANPTRCYDSATVKSAAKYNYVMECPQCLQKWYRYRMRQRNFRSECPQCRVKIEITALTH